MSGQDVIKEKLDYPLEAQFCSDNLKDGIQSMAEEIVLLRQRLGPAGYEMLLELKRLRSLEIDAKNYQKLLQASDVKLAKAIKERQDLWVALMDERRALDHSEYKRARLREALHTMGNWPSGYGAQTQCKACGGKSQNGAEPGEVIHGSVAYHPCFLGLTLAAEAAEDLK